MKTYAGFDTTDSVLGHGKEIKAAGYSWVMKYALPSADFPCKAWTKQELAELRIFGIKAGVVFETSNDIAHFTAANGAADAAKAVQALKLLKAPAGTTIFYSVDFDATRDELLNQILWYARAFRATAKESGFLVGVYGSGLVSQVLKAAGLAHFGWLAQSEGWAEYEQALAVDLWDIKQGSGKVLSFNSDTNEAKNLDWAF